mgnify:CR=1 FL=1
MTIALAYLNASSYDSDGFSSNKSSTVFPVIIPIYLEIAPAVGG